MNMEGPLPTNSVWNGTDEEVLVPSASFLGGSHVVFMCKSSDYLCGVLCAIPPPAPNQIEALDLYPEVSDFFLSETIVNGREPR